MHTTTATSAPGTLGTKRSKTTIRPTVSTEKPTAARFASGMEVIIVHCCENQPPLPLGTPSMSGICPDST